MGAKGAVSISLAEGHLAREHASRKGLEPERLELLVTYTYFVFFMFLTALQPCMSSCLLKMSRYMYEIHTINVRNINIAGQLKNSLVLYKS